MKDLTAVFTGLREMLLEVEASLTPSVDDSTQVRLDYNSEFFAAIKLCKSCVSYHLLPLYLDPSLREHASPELRTRLKGKACFNFTRLEPSHKQDLLALTRTALEQVKRSSTN